MGNANLLHRPLVAGIRIASGRTRQTGTLESITQGTLTGLATRNSDNKKVLVASS